MATTQATPERIAALPVWAQRHIDKLERDLESNRARLAAGPEDSDTFADPYSQSPRPLGSGTLILFGTQHGQRFRVRLDDDGRLEVQADSVCMIYPSASNLVRISSERG